MYNTISQLKRISVKPKHWIAIKSPRDSSYVLYFNHLHSNIDLFKDYAAVQNARGSTKYYKTLEALIKDARLVDESANVLIVSSVTSRESYRVP